MNATAKAADLNKLCETLAGAGIALAAPEPDAPEIYRAHLNGRTWDVTHTGTPNLWSLTGPGCGNGFGVFSGDAAALLTALATV
ncbi:hypothetical protein ACIQZB_00325 [Streptomyces sp. NPDC097727]|uniref:hypothetical protein n=1 Tax=Streptomyces sp. NPDC097727 TaxID=3366092 RepID=UPI0038213710